MRGQCSYDFAQESLQRLYDFLQEQVRQRPAPWISWSFLHRWRRLQAAPEGKPDPRKLLERLRDGAVLKMNESRIVPNVRPDGTAWVDCLTLKAYPEPAQLKGLFHRLQEGAGLADLLPDSEEKRKKVVALLTRLHGLEALRLQDPG
ncbi:MAG TPA: hypothetical protein VLU25_19985 [Acidobacteriota bacterium]|nr:hypothetical protein [Acidobacteriota bacterium]